MTNKRSMADDIIGIIREGTKKWTKTVKAEERSPASRSYRLVRMTRERGVSFKEAAAEILPEGYREVSGPNNLPANARQLMYKCRPHIQKVTGKPLNDNYFTQTLLPDYLDETGVAWNVAYDARGHFTEPHNGDSFGVGTLEVREYLTLLHEPELLGAKLSRARVATLGPSGNFGGVLFIEKEGFDPLIEAAKIGDRFDVAIMSTKGMSVTAARKLADEMCHEYDIPLLLARDFDKSGFSIAGTLQRDTRRYRFQNDITVIDLGLSLKDVEAMGLQFEHQFLKGKKQALIDNLRKNGATEAEVAFLFADFDQTRSIRRVELNAMTSPQFIKFLERKLREHGMEKVVPDKEQLAEAYRFFARNHSVETIVRRELKKLDGNVATAQVPKDLQRRVAKLLKQQPDLRWDAALTKIVGKK